MGNMKLGLVRVNITSYLTADRTDRWTASCSGSVGRQAGSREEGKQEEAGVASILLAAEQHW